MSEAMLTIDGIAVKTPSSFHCDIEPLYDDDSGRTLDGVMHLNYIASKRKLSCTWNGLNWAETSILMKLVPSNKFVSVRYPDIESGTYETRTFYTGPKGADAVMWTIGKKILSSITINLIEQ
jgi:hypothetical protein